MHNPSIFLRADEQMQLNPLCLILMDEYTELNQVGLMLRVPVLIMESLSILTTGVAHFTIHFSLKNNAIKKELHILPNTKIPLREATQLIHLITKNPNVLHAMEEKIYALTKTKEASPVIYDKFKAYKKGIASEKIGQFTISTLSEKIYLLEQHDDIITNIGSFKLTERGGYFNFTVTVATLYDSVAQTIQVNSKMYLFLDQKKLGYYFEFFLNHQNMLHQKIYEGLPDLLMENHAFLEKTLSVLEASTTNQPSVVELIERFRETL